MPATWGKDITILCVSDFNYLPGVYALFNSALLNGFEGKFCIVKMNDFDDADICQHPQIEIVALPNVDGAYHPNVARLTILPTLKEGKYLFLDADIIIERPIGFLLELIDTSILVSKETEPKYDSYDIIFQRQSRKVGYNPFNIKQDIGYINGGLLGFSLPRHADFIRQFVSKSFKHLEGITTTSVNPDWFFIDQDMLNVVIRGTEVPVSVISPRLLEIGNYPNNDFFNRTFPSSKQNHLFPKDQLKYVIHGAALRRPWINPYLPTLTGKLRKKVYDIGLNSFLSKPSPYERAWAYYACKEDLPIPFGSWSKKHAFTAHNNYLWKNAHRI